MGFVPAMYRPLRNCKYVMKNGRCNHLENRNWFNRGRQCVLDNSFVKECTKREGILRPNRPPPMGSGGSSLAYASSHTVTMQNTGSPPPMPPVKPPAPPARTVRLTKPERPPLVKLSDEVDK